MQNKILITGATGGIGLALVKIYLRQGEIVCGVDINQEKLSELKVELGENFHPYSCDLTDSQSLNSTFQMIYDQEGLPDVIINNAGIAHVDSFEEEGQDAFDQVMKINFDAVVRSCRFWIPHLEARGQGTIANMASVAGHVAPAGMTSYAASKFAVVGFTRSLNLELQSQKSKVKICLISPGFVATKIMRIGEEKGFPKELSFLVSTPEKCAQNIWSGITNGEEEIYPTINGKAMLLMQRFIPMALAKINVLVSKKALKN